MLKDKIVVLSGCNGSLGPIWKRTMLSAGAYVYGFDLPVTDVRDEESLLEYKKYFSSNNLVPDIIINNAAVDHPPQGDVTFWTDTENIIKTNLIGAVNLTFLFLPWMIERGSGLIINIGSIQGNVAADWRNYEGFEKPVGYNLSKAGLIQFTRSLAVQYGKYGIRSVCISFAAVDNGKFKEPFKSNFLKCLPLGRFISVQSLEQTLLYACTCPELTGQQILVDSGYTAW